MNTLWHKKHSLGALNRALEDINNDNKIIYMTKQGLPLKIVKYNKNNDSSYMITQYLNIFIPILQNTYCGHVNTSDVNNNIL